MKILGVETSCDETGIAIYCEEEGIIANRVYSQIRLHQKYGGVIPELASRDHIRKTLPLIQEVLEENAIKRNEISAIAYTAGPGLVGALLVGASVAKSLALAWGIPSLGIHHMEGHLLATLLTKDPPAYPFIALLISGGHTQLIACYRNHRYQLLGESQDDAAGEAFDKVAKMLGLAYPGGPEIEKLAKKGDSERFYFPRPMTRKPGLDFSFSGLKTAVMNEVKSLEKIRPQDAEDLAAGFQKAALDTIKIKCERALDYTGLKRLVIAGGVSANMALRENLERTALEKEFKIYYPPLDLCTDNGAMIAFAGYQRLKSGQKEDLTIKVKARWPLADESI
ncbi:MAG: tRNA (adenosine(37)-N6)-threonylcarbamoyltransferase complex transferase subunit TsaD [Gammaproteobacteria bacterium]|nr:tRNA (adenosine(37)-N6)-threonylcarbamoyltransferase complex transferase subunit TsaD [Gammaproteobacteria bacterium]